MNGISVPKERYAREPMKVTRRGEKFRGHTQETNPGRRVRVFIAAENRLLREALARVIVKCASNEVAGIGSCTLDANTLEEKEASVLLIASRGNLDEDCALIVRARARIADLRILLIGMARDAEEFLRCVCAGISGYLLRDASAEEVLDAVRAVYAGEAVCPRSLCCALFRYVESQRPATRSISEKQVEITGRQQQLIPLIAQGLTNKEIAGKLSLSEFTVKNHIYRMMRKTGAKSRRDVAQLDAAPAHNEERW